MVSIAGAGIVRGITFPLRSRKKSAEAIFAGDGGVLESIESQNGQCGDISMAETFVEVGDSMRR